MCEYPPQINFVPRPNFNTLTRHVFFSTQFEMVGVVNALEFSASHYPGRSILFQPYSLIVISFWYWNSSISDTKPLFFALSGELTKPLRSSLYTSLVIQESCRTRWSTKLRNRRSTRRHLKIHLVLQDISC